MSNLTNTRKREILNAILDTLPHDRDRIAHLRIVIRYAKDLTVCTRHTAYLVRAETEFGRMHSR